MDKLICIETFIESVRCGSLRKAATELCQTEASISKRITRLELDLGVTLMERNRSGLKLTDIGEQYYQMCQQGIASLDSADQYVKSLKREPRGKLNVVCNYFFAKRSITPRLKSFLKKYPRINLSLDVLELFPDFSEYNMDILFGVGMPLPNNSDLIQKRLGVTQEVLCATPKYLKLRTITKASDLANADYIAHSHRKSLNIIMLDKGVEVSVSPKLLCNNAQASIDMALQHMGFIWIKKYQVADHLQSEKLIQILPKYTKQDVPIYAYYPCQAYPDSKIKAFMDFFSINVS